MTKSSTTTTTTNNESMFDMTNCSISDYSDDQLLLMTSAIMSSLGIKECDNSGKSISGDCKPVGKYNVECKKIDEYNDECGGGENYQSTCSVISGLLGKLFRGCDSAYDSKGIVNENGGCNNEVMDLSGIPLQCNQFINVSKAMLGYLNLISCVVNKFTFDINTDSHFVVNSNVTFKLINSFCGGDLTVKSDISSFKSENINITSTTSDDVDIIINYGNNVIIEVLKLLLIINDLNDGIGKYSKEEYQEIIQECIDHVIESTNVDSSLHRDQRTSSIYIMSDLDFNSTVDILIKNSSIQGECNASQSVEINYVVETMLNSSMSFFNDNTSFKSLREGLQSQNTIPREKSNYIWIIVICVLVIILGLIVGWWFLNNKKKKLKSV
jgi:hypothetical protein